MERAGTRTRLSRRECAVLQRLVDAHGEPVTRDELSRVWDESPGPRAVDYAIRRLRAKLEPDPATPRHLLSHHGIGYAFVPERPSTDIPVRKGHRLPLPDGWVELEAGLVRRRGQPMTTLTGRELALLQRLVDAAPEAVSREKLARDVWGRRATSATRYVDHVVYRLRAKLEPSPDSPCVVVTIPRIGVVVQTGARRNWRTPPSPPGLVGREAVLARLAPHLEVPGARVTLHGPGGIGKTTLAQAAAASWAGPAALVEVRSARSESDVWAALAFAIGVDTQEQPPGVRLQDALDAAEHGLLVLDEAEHAARHVAAVLAQLPASPVRVLVTSRRVLGHAGEQVFTVPPLEASAARELFCAHAERRGSDVRDEPLDGVVGQLGGIPLAIELAASRLGGLGIDLLQKHLAAPLGVLRRANDAGGRHDSLEQALEDSWATLSVDDQELLAGCTMLGPSFRPEVASAVLGQRFPDVGAGLQRLLDAALLGQSSEGRLAPSYAVRAFVKSRDDLPHVGSRDVASRHDDWVASLGSGDPLRPPTPSEVRAGWAELPTALEVLERLRVSGDLRALSLALWCQFMLTIGGFEGRARALSEQVCESFPGHRVALWAQFLALLPERSEAALDAVRAVLDAVDPEDAREEHQVALACATYAMADHGDVDDALRERCRSQLEDATTTPLAHTHLAVALGWAAFRSGRGREAWSWLEPALGQARAHGFPWLAQRIAHNLTGLAIAERRFDEAEVFLEAAREVWPATGLPAEPVRVLDMHGLLRLEQGRLEEADVIHLGLRDRAVAVGDRVTAATVCSRLGSSAGLRGDLARAAIWFEEFRSAARALGWAAREYAARINLGIVALTRGRLEESHRHFGAAADGYRAIAWLPHAAYADVWLADVDLEQGDARSAERRLEGALRDLETAGRTLWLGEALALLGVVRAELGRGEAEATLGRSHALLESADATPSRIAAWARVGLAARARGDEGAAKRALEAARALGQPPITTRAGQLLERLASE